MDAALRLYGPDSVWDASALGLGMFTGPDVIRREMENWVGILEDFEVDIEEIARVTPYTGVEQARADARRLVRSQDRGAGH